MYRTRRFLCFFHLDTYVFEKGGDNDHLLLAWNNPFGIDGALVTLGSLIEAATYIFTYTSVMFTVYVWNVSFVYPCKAMVWAICFEVSNILGRLRTRLWNRIRLPIPMRTTTTHTTTATTSSATTTTTTTTVTQSTMGAFLENSVKPALKKVMAVLSIMQQEEYLDNFMLTTTFFINVGITVLTALRNILFSHMDMDMDTDTDQKDEVVSSAAQARDEIIWSFRIAAICVCYVIGMVLNIQHNRRVKNQKKYQSSSLSSPSRPPPSQQRSDEPWLQMARSVMMIDSVSPSSSAQPPTTAYPNLQMGSSNGTMITTLQNMSDLPPPPVSFGGTPSVTIPTTSSLLSPPPSPPSSLSPPSSPSSSIEPEQQPPSSPHTMASESSGGRADDLFREGPGRKTTSDLTTGYVAALYEIQANDTGRKEGEEGGRDQGGGGVVTAGSPITLRTRTRARTYNNNVNNGGTAIGDGE